MRLDRFVCNKTGQSLRTVCGLLAKGLVLVEGGVVKERLHQVSEFCSVEVEGTVLQDRTAHYVMLHKPEGYLSATSDDEHRTVMELIDPKLRDELHIGGRLDFNTTGLLLLTNDGNWSRRITEPKLKKPKVYWVETRDPIGAEYEPFFKKGVYLETEDITTQPAQLEIHGDREARLTIYEGRYRQVKRMFGLMGNRVMKLHRESMGPIVLDPQLKPGDSRPLNQKEIDSV